MASSDEINRLRNEVSDDEEIETTFRRLRQEGHSRQETVRLLLDALDVSLREAKTLLLTSETWAEARRTATDSDPGGTEAGGSGDNPVPPAPG